MWTTASNNSEGSCGGNAACVFQDSLKLGLLSLWLNDITSFPTGLSFLLLTRSDDVHKQALAKHNWTFTGQSFLKGTEEGCATVSLCWVDREVKEALLKSPPMQHVWETPTAVVAPTKLHPYTQQNTSHVSPDPLLVRLSQEAMWRWSPRDRKREQLQSKQQRMFGIWALTLCVLPSSFNKDAHYRRPKQGDNLG